MSTVAKVGELSKEEQFAKGISEGKTIKDAMIDAGYPKSRALRGTAGLTKKMVRAMADEGYKLAEFGKSLDLETLKNIAIGRLATNAIQGKDGGVMSAKQIGQHKDIGLWVAESMAGVIMINVPNQAIENKSKVIDASPEAEL
jgi:hypothetical protein